MNFVIKEILPNINYFSIQHSDVVYRQNTDLYLNKVMNNKYQYFGHLNEKYMQYGKFGRHFIFNKIDRLEVEIPQVLSPIGFDGIEAYYVDNFHYDKIEKRSKCDIVKYNVITGECTVILINTSSYLAYSDLKMSYLIFSSVESIIRYSFNETEYNWQTDLTEYCKYPLPDQEVQGIIRKVLGVYNDKLWVWTDNSQLLVLDINTGTVISRHRIPDLDPILTYHGFLFPYFDEKRGVIAFLEHRFYIEFNLDTLQLSTLKSFDTGHPDTDWNFSINTFSDDYVYFTARRGPDRSSPSHLGIFNRQSMEVEWGQDLELWKTDPYCFLNQPPQYAAGKLYALDNKGTLHIFEREEVA